MILSGKIIIDYIRHYFNCSENEAKKVLEELPSNLNNYYEIFKEIFPGLYSYREINREDKEMIAQFLYYYCLVVWNKEAQYLTYYDLKPIIKCALYDFDTIEKGLFKEKEELIEWYQETKKEIGIGG